VIPGDILSLISGYLGTPSTISDHGIQCCHGGRAWLHGVDASNSYRDSRWQPPTWLRREYEWGPVAWPLYWCSLPDMEKLDCGALAAVAVELYRLRGLPVTPVQLALRYPHHATEQWSRMWEREGLSSRWITDGFCYHEACGVIEGEQLLLWDPTENRWLDPPLSSKGTFATVMALKIAVSTPDVPANLHWGDTRVRSGVWQSVVFDARGSLTTACS
jgi:hypothetical protein